MEYDICGGRFRLLPPLPFDALSLLKMLNFAQGDVETVLTLQSFENKTSPSKDNELKFPDLRSSARTGVCVACNVPRRYICAILQLSEGFDKGVAVFNHWKVHNGCDTDCGQHAHSNGSEQHGGDLEDWGVGDGGSAARDDERSDGSR